MPEFSDHEIKPILLVGKDGSVAVHPRTAADCLRSGPPLFVLSSPTNSKLVGSKVVPSQEVSVIFTLLDNLEYLDKFFKYKINNNEFS